MKTSMRQLAACGAMVWGLATVACGEATVQLLDISGRVQAKPLVPAVFANHDINLSLEIDNAPSGSGDLTADFFQLSGQLMLPLNKSMHLRDGIALGSGAAQKLPVSIKFPDVKQRGEILVRLALVPHGGATSAIALGELRFEVFSDALTKEFAELLQPRTDGTIPAVLFGPERKLAGFFTSLKVPFDQAGLDVPGQFEANRIYFGETADEGSFAITQDIREKVRMAVFSPDPALPVGIYSEQKPAASFVYVTAPILDNLDTDPRAQLALLKIIHYLIVPNSSTNTIP
jgi:hypothetical protein